MVEVELVICFVFMISVLIAPPFVKLKYFLVRIYAIDRFQGNSLSVKYLKFVSWFFLCSYLIFTPFMIITGTLSKDAASVVLGMVSVFAFPLISRVVIGLIKLV